MCTLKYFFRLSGCNLSEKSCEALSSVLSSQSSSLRVLDLNNNNLLDSGVQPLSVGLKSPHCKLDTLRSELKKTCTEWKITVPLCSYCFPVILLVLISDTALKAECKWVKSNRGKILHVSLVFFFFFLRLSGCNLSKRSCEALSSVFSSQSSRLRELNLGNNDLQDSGVKSLSVGLKSPHCKLETLRSDFSFCYMTTQMTAQMLFCILRYCITNICKSFVHCVLFLKVYNVLGDYIIYFNVQ